MKEDIATQAHITQVLNFINKRDGEIKLSELNHFPSQLLSIMQRKKLIVIKKAIDGYKVNTGEVYGSNFMEEDNFIEEVKFEKVKQIKKEKELCEIVPTTRVDKTEKPKKVKIKKDKIEKPKKVKIKKELDSPQRKLRDQVYLVLKNSDDIVTREKIMSDFPKEFGARISKVLSDLYKMGMVDKVRTSIAYYIDMERRDLLLKIKIPTLVVPLTDSKKESVLKFIETVNKAVTRKYIHETMNQTSLISLTTIEKVLVELVESGLSEKVRRGNYVFYAMKNNEDAMKDLEEIKNNSLENQLIEILKDGRKNHGELLSLLNAKLDSKEDKNISYALNKLTKNNLIDITKVKGKYFYLLPQINTNNNCDELTTKD